MTMEVMIMEKEKSNQPRRIMTREEIRESIIRYAKLVENPEEEFGSEDAGKQQRNTHPGQKMNTSAKLKELDTK